MTSAQIPVIAIDGPSGVGKSTVACQLAQALNYHVLISGVLYRVLGMQLHNQAIALNDARAIAALVADMDVAFCAHEGGAQIYLNGRLMSDTIYSEDYASVASAAGASATVRRALLARQRHYRRSPGLVADGRDMATVVFPDASPKIFLQADRGERAQRRLRQLKQRGICVTLDALNKELQHRDARDSRRAIARLKVADDAIVVDTTQLSIAEVVAQVMRIVRA